MCVCRSGNRVFFITQVSDIPPDEVGQIISLNEDTSEAVVKLDNATTTSHDTVQVPLDCLENLPRRFAGTLCKYSTSAIIFKNWKIRYIEVWSNSLTYREENSSNYKGHVPITPTTEIITLIGKPKPPMPHSFGILNNGKIFRLCSDNEQLVEEMKRAIQDCINDAVMYEGES